jgi:multicomponent Na+:H+ antiporter subunit C
MTILMAIAVCVVFAVSVYLLLSRDLKTVAMGVFLVSHAAHLAILAMSGQPMVPVGDELVMLGAPVTGTGQQPVDPLPQALILTSIVISFAVMAFMLTLLVATHRKVGTLDVGALGRCDQFTPSNLEADDGEAVKADAA